MSVIQVEDLVTYQLRTSYLNDIADGVGERLLTLNDSFLNTAAFKAAGWRPNPSHIKRTHSPPIPTAVASEYFQAPRAAGLTLEDEHDDGGGGGVLGGAGMGLDTVGPSQAAASKRRRRREQMGEDDEDSSDLSDESDDEPDQRAAQQIKFAKMPLRNRSGSSPIQSSNLRQVSTVSSPQRAPGTRRGSQSALETVKERTRRDTVTSSDVSSENELDTSTYQRQREQARAQARAARMQTRLNSDTSISAVKRQESDLLEEEEDSDASDGSSVFVGSIDSASILNVADNPMNASPRQQIVGTPPREFTRASTIRKSHAPPPHLVADLPPPRPVSMVRPLSMIQPKSLLSEALKAKKTKPAIPFDKFASLSGQGDPNPIRLRIYAMFSKNSNKPYEVAIRRTVQQGQGGDRTVTVADLIGLSLWRYNDEKREPPLPTDRLNVNWWTLRMAEEGGEVDDDFPPLERMKQLTSFTTANNRAGRMRSNSKVYDEFALVQASEEEFAENQRITPQFTEEASQKEEPQEDELTPRNTPQASASALAAPSRPRQNPIITTTYRHDTNLLADMPPAPVAVANTNRGKKKLLRVHIHSADAAPGQMVTVDVTTDTYLEEVLDLVCKKRQLDKAAHVLKLPGSGAVVLVDREVSSIGNLTDLELHRRRFATDGPSTMAGASPSSASPSKMFAAAAGGGGGGGEAVGPSAGVAGSVPRIKKKVTIHPLARELPPAEDDLGPGAGQHFVSDNYRKYTVWRRQPMRFANLNERVLTIDGEYVHLAPSSAGKTLAEPGGGKKVTVHFSNVIGCKVSRRHPNQFKLVFFKATESKRYDFEARSAGEAAEIVGELKKGISPYRDV